MKKIVLGICLLTMTLSLNGCNNKNTIESINLNKQNNNIDVIQKEIENMTLYEKIGQIITVGIDGYTINDKTKELIVDKKVGGIILFKDNINDSNQLLQLINNIKDINSKNKIPLFISIDEEGGRVSRLPKEIKKLPSNEVIGNINDKKLAYDIGETIGYSLKSFGFNMDFAPVLDINSNPNNKVIGDRAFSSNKNIVANLGVSEINGFKSSNIISVAKHFPGHGDTDIDSHYKLPIINKTLDELKEVEFVPFKNAIKENVPSIMVSHILLPEIDDINPASMSKTIITDILRKDLKFDGLIVTDDMTMVAITNNFDISEACIKSINAGAEKTIITDILRKDLKFDGLIVTDDMTMVAITNNFDISEACIKSINAGADLLLICHGYETEVDVINNIKDAVDKGIISIDRINESVYRILSLKYSYKINNEKIENIDVDISR